MFSQLREILRGGEVIVSKKGLKHFVCWLSVEISDFNMQNVDSILFWDKIGELLTLEGENGDETTSLFLLMFFQIRKQLLDRAQRTTTAKYPNFPSPFSKPLYP